MKVREGFVHVLWDHWHPDCLYRVFPTAIVVTRIDKATALAYAILCTLVVGTFTQEIALHIQYHLASLSAEKVELYRVFLKLGFKLSLSLSRALARAPLYTLDHAGITERMVRTLWELWLQPMLCPQRRLDQHHFLSRWRPFAALRTAFLSSAEFWAAEVSSRGAVDSTLLQHLLEDLNDGQHLWATQCFSRLI